MLHFITLNIILLCTCQCLAQHSKVYTLYETFKKTVNQDVDAAAEIAKKLNSFKNNTPSDQMRIDMANATMHRLNAEYVEAKELILESLEINKDADLEAISAAWLSVSLSYDYLGIIDSCAWAAKNSIKAALSAENNKMAADAFQSLGVSYYYAGNCDSAMVNYDKARRFYLKANDTIDIGGVLTNEANCLYNLGQLSESIVLLRRAEKIYETSPENRYLLALIRENIGHQSYETQNYDLAFKYLNNAMEIHKDFGDSMGIARCYMKLGFVYDDKKQHDLALEALFKSERILKNNNGDKLLDNVYNSIGAVHANSGNHEQAIVYLEKSVEMKREKYDPIGMITTLTNLADNYNKTGRLKEAYQTAMEVLDMHKEHNFYLQLGLIYGVLADYYASIGDYKNGYYYSTKRNMWSDSIYSVEKQEALSEMEVKYETEKKDQEIKMANILAGQEKDKRVLAEAKAKKEEAQLKEEQAEKRNIYIGLGALALLTLAVVWALRNKRRDNKLISQQKQIAEEQKELVEEKNKEILDSINYAKRIQTAILPPNKLVKEYLQSSFILYKPKDIVAGDFYWMEVLPGSPPLEESEEVGNTILFAAADCTGHGVPGAMVSVVCNNGLNRSVREYGLQEPGKILDKTREIVISEFEKSEEEVKDGMDIALCSLTFAQSEKQSVSGSKDSIEIDGKARSASASSSAKATGGTQTVSDYSALLKYAGAHNPLWIIRRNVSAETGGGYALEEVNAEFSAETKLEEHSDYLFIEVKADKQPIGKFDDPLPYTTHTIKLNEGDSFYIFSDGYADQFGGEKGKKLKAKNFKTLLLSIQNESMERQRELIDEAFEDWKGKYEQLDDVCVIGVRV